MVFLFGYARKLKLMHRYKFTATVGVLLKLKRSSSLCIFFPILKDCQSEFLEYWCRVVNDVDVQVVNQYNFIVRTHRTHVSAGHISL